MVKRTAALLLLAAFGYGCQDPVHDERVDALGGEAPGVPKGPTHRPGQPCTVCHGGQGPGDPTFDLAGTVYERPSAGAPARGAKVTSVDSSGTVHSIFTNEVGNFYWEEGDLAPTFPIWVSVELCGTVIEMETPIFRETACATCHNGESQSSVPPVYVAEEGEPLCP